MYDMTKQTNRLLALDVLRGITIAGMILVNDPGSWGAVYAPLCHASWNGLTPTDLVFPFFMFIMGVSMYFSLRKYDFTFSGEAAVKIFRRATVIFLIGVGINWFALWFSAVCSPEEMPLGERLTLNLFPFDRLRILGVMQRLAIAYLGGSFVESLDKAEVLSWGCIRHFIGLFFYFMGRRRVRPVSG